MRTIICWFHTPIETKTNKCLNSGGDNDPSNVDDFTAGLNYAFKKDLSISFKKVNMFARRIQREQQRENPGSDWYGDIIYAKLLQIEFNSEVFPYINFLDVVTKGCFKPKNTFENQLLDFVCEWFTLFVEVKTFRSSNTGELSLIATNLDEYEFTRKYRFNNQFRF